MKWFLLLIGGICAFICGAHGPITGLAFVVGSGAGVLYGSKTDH